MRRRVAAVVVGAVVALGLPGVAQAQEPIREPIIGACIRPILFKIIDLPGLNVPAERIPWEPIELSLGGQYDDCNP